MAITAEQRLTAAEMWALPVAEREAYLRERQELSLKTGIVLGDPSNTPEQEAEAQATFDRLMSLRAQRRGD